jgi:hypothetical protein
MHCWPPLYKRTDQTGHRYLTKVSYTMRAEKSNQSIAACRACFALAIQISSSAALYYSISIVVVGQMMARPDIISQAFKTGLLKEDDTEGRGWTSMRDEVDSMLNKADNRTTLFLGAAASSFKPTCFPAWDQFIELIYTCQIQQAISELPAATTGS